MGHHSARCCREGYASMSCQIEGTCVLVPFAPEGMLEREHTGHKKPFPLHMPVTNTRRVGKKGMSPVCAGARVCSCAYAHAPACTARPCPAPHTTPAVAPGCAAAAPPLPGRRPAAAPPPAPPAATERTPAAWDARGRHGWPSPTRPSPTAAPSCAPPAPAARACAARR